MAVLIALGLAVVPAPCPAQTPTVPSIANPAPDARSIEDLNLVGAAVTMPSFSDNLVPVDSAFRQALFAHGMLLRVNVIPRFTQNLLDRPAASGQQVYIGTARRSSRA